MAQKDENVLINELTLNRYQSQTKKILDNSLNIPKTDIFFDSGADPSSSAGTTAAKATQTSVIWSKVLDAIGTQMKLDKETIFPYIRNHHIATFTSPNSNKQDITIPNLSGGQPIPKAIAFVRISGNRSTSKYHGIYTGEIYEDGHPTDASGYDICPIAYLVLTISPPGDVNVQYDVAAVGIYSHLTRDYSNYYSPIYYMNIEQGASNDSTWDDVGPSVKNNGYAQWQSSGGGYIMPLSLTLTLPGLNGYTGCLYGSYECFVF